MDSGAICWESWPRTRSLGECSEFSWTHVESEVLWGHRRDVRWTVVNISLSSGQISRDRQWLKLVIQIRPFGGHSKVQLHWRDCVNKREVTDGVRLTWSLQWDTSSPEDTDISTWAQCPYRLIITQRLKIVSFVVVVQSLSHVWLFCKPMDCSPSGSSVHGISQQEILEWVTISFSRGSSWTHVSWIGRWILYHWAIREGSPDYPLFHIEVREFKFLSDRL